MKMSDIEAKSDDSPVVPAETEVPGPDFVEPGVTAEVTLAPEPIDPAEVPDDQTKLADGLVDETKPADVTADGSQPPVDGTQVPADGTQPPADGSQLAPAPVVKAREPIDRSKMLFNLVAIVLGIVLVAVGFMVGWLVRGEVSGITKTPAALFTPGQQVTPPDGDAQHAWITAPSANTKPDALIVDIHTDYQCPICQRTESIYGAMFSQLNDQGDIILRHHIRTFLDYVLSNNSSTKAAIAAACMDVADNTKYEAFHQLIFTNQPSEGTGFTDDQLRNQWPAMVGLTGKPLATYQGCYDAQATSQFVKDSETNNIKAVPNQNPPNAYLFGGNQPIIDTDGSCSGTAGTQIGVCGTPTIFVNGVQVSLGVLLNNDWSPKAATADDLLALLKQAAG